MSMIETPMLQSLERLLDVSVFRHSLLASNLANIDTPGYRTRDINFQAALRQTGAGPFEYDEFTPVARPVQGLVERPDGNNVSLERESLLLAQNQLQFNAGIQLIKVEFRRLSIAINEGR